MIRKARLIYEARRNDHTYNRLSLVPFLRLRGIWLRKAGFDVGDDVTIEVHPGVLIIRKASA